MGSQARVFFTVLLVIKLTCNAIFMKVTCFCLGLCISWTLRSSTSLCSCYCRSNEEGDWAVGCLLGVCNGVLVWMMVCLFNVLACLCDGR